MHLGRQILITSLIIFVAGIFSTAEAKSLYAITDHDASTLIVYNIQGDRLKHQAHTYVTKYATGAVGLAIDSNLKILFITYESSAVIEWVNAETLAQEGFITISGVSNLAGIVADEAKQRVYTVERESNRLYICTWDRDKQELVLMDPPYVTLTDLDNNGAWGLALDETTGRLYVGNNTNMVHFYDTNDWTHLGARDVGRPAADVAVDPSNGQHNAYLYIGALYRRAGQGHYFLVKHDLEASDENISNIENEIGTVPIGLAVDPDSGLLYITTPDRQIRVYDCSKTPFICTLSVDTGARSGGCGICVPTKDVSYKWPLALRITDNTIDNDCLSMGDHVAYTINYGNTITKPSDPNYVGVVNDVVIIDYLPPETDFDSASENGVYDSNLHTVTWDIGLLSPGNSDFVTVTAKINKNAEQGGAITNYCEMQSKSTHNKAKVNTLVCHWCSWNPSPANGATGVKQTPILHWSPGDNAAQHDVYLGTNEAKVSNADTRTAGIHRGRQTATNYAPGELQWGQTYYWRIDEINNLDIRSPWKGSVWSFTTADYIIVDDFEDYNDDSDRIFQTWIDGFGYTDPSPGHPGNGTGSTVGYVDPPFTEQTTVHEGGQSMPFNYNNITRPYYSIAERTFDVPQDWTRKGVKALALWFHGDLGNSAEQLYVGVQDSAATTTVVNHDNSDATMLNTWQEWNIDLREFSDAGVNLKNIKKMYIGVGDRTGQQPGGSGMLYFDDARLYRPRCIPELAQPDNDLSGNCVVDYADLEIMSRQWLDNGAGLTADLDVDGDIDLNDYAGLADSWLDEQLWPSASGR